MKIIADAFGGDNAPLEMRRAAASVRRIRLFHSAYGRQGKDKLLKNNGISLDGMDILHAPDIIGMEDEPSILKSKSESSMAAGLKALARAGRRVCERRLNGCARCGRDVYRKRSEDKAYGNRLRSAVGKGPRFTARLGANAECHAENPNAVRAYERRF